MEEIKDFDKIFNRNFWKAFSNKPFFDIPKNHKEKTQFIINLKDTIKTNNYYPHSPKCCINRNKGNGVTRVIPVFRLEDYCVYYYCIRTLESKIAYNRVPNTFGGWTISGLLRKSENDEMVVRQNEYNEYEELMANVNGVSISEYSFNPTAWSKAYGDLNAKLYATAQESDFNFVAELDIANFYDSIRLDILENKIREISDKQQSEAVSLLFHFLNYWNRDVNIYNKQTVGIPQDAMGDCSRILANFYLQDYDKYIFDLCEKTNGRYLRYADDQFIFANSIEGLKYLIFKASLQLNRYGLSINQKKTKILKTSDLITHRSFEIFDLVKEKESQNDPDIVSSFVDYYLELVDTDGIRKTKDKGRPLLHKALCCNALRDIDFLKRNRILSFCFDNEYLENSQSIYFYKIYCLLPDDHKIEFVKKLHNLSYKLIHSAFHYEVLYFLEKINHNTSLIKKRIKELETI
jgi:hypothetical protein